LIEAFSKFDDSLGLSANSQPSNQAGSTKALCSFPLINQHETRAQQSKVRSVKMASYFIHAYRFATSERHFLTANLHQQPTKHAKQASCFHWDLAFNKKTLNINRQGEANWDLCFVHFSKDTATH
jgi:hypothetical protein